MAFEQATVVNNPYLATSLTNIQNSHSTQKNNPQKSYAFLCTDNSQFTISYSGTNNDQAKLTLPGNTTYQLTIARSGSGTRYVNKDGSVLYLEHQGEATVQINGKNVYQNCALQTELPRTSQMSGEASSSMSASSTTATTSFGAQNAS
jgi:membrane-bound inhibitor of C-type lysozyme